MPRGEISWVCTESRLRDPIAPSCVKETRRGSHRAPRPAREGTFLYYADVWESGALLKEVSYWRLEPLLHLLEAWGPCLPLVSPSACFLTVRNVHPQGISHSSCQVLCHLQAWERSLGLGGGAGVFPLVNKKAESRIGDITGGR